METALLSTGALKWITLSDAFKGCLCLGNSELTSVEDIDTALTLLQNKLRRQILERLVREPHYAMQLADLLDVSQQAIVKHLRELERGNFVTKMKVASEKGGPPRTIYSVQQSISLRIDLGPDLFLCEQRSLPAGGPMRLSNRLPNTTEHVVKSVSGRKKISVGEGMAHIQHLNGILEEIDAQRDAVIALHQHIRNRISAGVDSDFEHYQQRTMVHSLIEAPERKLDLTDLRRELQLGQTEMATLLDEVRNRLERQLSDRAGHIIAVPNNSNLRFWLGSLPQKKE
jgi:predicted transcriptional regulator